MSDGNNLTKGNENRRFLESPKTEKSVLIGKKKEEPSNGSKVLEGFVALSIMCFNGLIWLSKKFLDLAVWCAEMVAKKTKK